MWVYIDNKKGEKIFTFDGDASISDADKAYEVKFGILPSHKSQLFIGCYNTKWGYQK